MHRDYHLDLAPYESLTYLFTGYGSHSGHMVQERGYKDIIVAQKLGVCMLFMLDTEKEARQLLLLRISIQRVTTTE